MKTTMLLAALLLVGCSNKKQKNDNNYLITFETAGVRANAIVHRLQMGPQDVDDIMKLIHQNYSGTNPAVILSIIKLD